MADDSHNLPPTAAERADRHLFYECAVQSPAAEVDFVDRTYRLTARAQRPLAAGGFLRDSGGLLRMGAPTQG